MKVAVGVRASVVGEGMVGRGVTSVAGEIVRVAVGVGVGEDVVGVGSDIVGVAVGVGVSVGMVGVGVAT